jgi:nucleoside-diphosphate-sugar epimerase
LESSGKTKIVLVTGAGGFIGGHVVREFLAQGWRVVAAVHRRVPAWLQELDARGSVRLVQADLCDDRQVQSLAAVPGWGPLAAIVHCAGRASDVGWDRAFRRANLESVRHLGRLARAESIPRFVFISTTDVYGLRDFHGETEDQLALRAFPANPYPAYKIAAEHWLRANLESERCVILRPAQVWGPGDTTLTRRIIDFLRWSPWIVHFGKWKGSNRWPLAHVQNVATACFLAATEPSAAGQTIQVLDDEVTTMDDWYRQVAALYLPGKRFRTLTLPMALGVCIGLPVRWLSTLLNRAHPLMDPTDYAVHAVGANLDFDNTRFRTLFQTAGRRLVTRAEGLQELRLQN